jgi:flavin-dependent dehydrogenase
MLTRADVDWDVVVVGGGPAGSSAAGILANRGFRVTLVEGAKFPRRHVGESLLAVSMPYLKELGVADIIENGGFVKKFGALFSWGNVQREMRLSMPYPGFAYQVARDRFDELLLRAAQSAGVHVVSEKWARDIVHDLDSQVTSVVIRDAHGEETLSARYAVDASGLFQFLQKRLNLPQETDGHQRAAIVSYYEGALPPEAAQCDGAGAEQGDIITEAADNSWLWFIPLGGQFTSVGMVTDADLVERRNPQEALECAIAETALVSRLLKPARLAQKARLLRYTNHIVTAPLWTGGHVMVGDSAMFVDPLFSTGVHGALLSATWAAAALEQVLRGKVADADAADWYDRAVRRHYNRVNELVRLLYGFHPGPGEFWARRKVTSLGESEAEASCRRLGAAGAEFFVKAYRKDAIAMPSSFTKRLAEFRVDMAPRPCALTDTPVLGREIGLSEGLVYGGGSLGRGVNLRHARSRTVDVGYKNGSILAEALTRMDGQATVGGISQALGLSEDNRRMLSLGIGALTAAGLVQVRP